MMRNNTKSREVTHDCLSLTGREMRWKGEIPICDRSDLEAFQCLPVPSLVPSSGLWWLDERTDGQPGCRGGRAVAILASPNFLVISPPTLTTSPSQAAVLSAGRAAAGSHLIASRHDASVAASACWLLHDSCNRHAKCIIHKLFSATFCTVALIIIITEAQ